MEEDLRRRRSSGSGGAGERLQSRQKNREEEMGQRADLEIRAQLERGAAVDASAAG